ncbi:interactor of constitutive active ROPs protein [Perilla frutescens var. frutescens]|nr:interactor of constitutive active ROPs protein [Perilla frutescens var. frutescens]
MAHGGGDGARAGPDFDLPDEILSVIPTDPYDQLDLARKITSMAIASRVTKLETEAGRLRQKLHDKDRLIEELEDKVAQLDGAFQDAEFRLKITREDNMKLLKERDSLSMTAKKLSRDLAKLETFKRQLMQSLNDENSPQHQSETVDIGTYDQSVPKAYSTNDESNGYAKHHSYGGSTDSANINDEVSKQAGQNFSLTPYITPRLTPTGTPKVISTSVSPRRYSAATSPQKTSGATSPTANYEGKGSFSSWYPSSQQSSAANSPPRGRPLPGRTPRIDGKEFFRQARSRLSLEQFSAFLANIKELNAQRQSREETLRKAEEIFGTDNKDLYISFQGLLNRNTH